MSNSLFIKVTGIVLGAALLVGASALCASVLSDDEKDEDAQDVAADVNTEDGQETGTGEDGQDAEDGEQAAEDSQDGEDAPEQEPEKEPYQPPVLKGLDGAHEAYVSGYNDGTFRPEDTLTRAEAASMLFRIIEAPGDERAEFSDVPENAWYRDSVGYFGAIGVFDGEDGNVWPDEELTRGEFAAVIVRMMLGRDAEWAGTCPYEDVAEDDPWLREICLASENGWFLGAGENKFLPEDILTRAEAVTVINRLRGGVPDREYMKNYFFSPYSDVFADYWAYYDIMEASVAHAHNGGGSGAWTSGDLTPYASPKGKYFVGLDYYYFGDNGRPVVNGTVGGLYFGPDGRFTSGDERVDKYVKDVLSSVTNSGMTDMEKLRAAYVYTRDSFSYLRRNYYDVGDVSWANNEAYTMFSTGRGNCYCYSAVFYSLARQLGFDAVLISGKVNNSNPIPHAWVEIAENGQMYMYDAELEMAHIRDGSPFDLWHMAYDATPWSYWR